MAIASERRVRHARRSCGEADLRARALAMAAAPRLGRSREDFDIIAEVKRRAPSSRQPSGADRAVDRAHDPEFAARLSSAYARGGAVAVSVLTEPLAFAGSLDDLAAAARALEGAERPVPVMRKDFILSPYQVYEARAAGAGGILLIADMLDDPAAARLMDAIAETGLWVLVEAFGAEPLERAVDLARGAAAAGVESLIGVNARNLRDLRIDDVRHARGADSLPPDVPWVAESGMRTAEDIARAARLGYRLALVGSALVAAAEPERSLAAMIAAGRAARRAA
jgi:indole-3-glycerol phosphate synthase